MDTKEILEFVYKMVQIMNGIIGILKAFYEIKDQKEEKKIESLYIRKRANACKTLTQRSERSTQSFSDQELIILFLVMELNKRGYFDDLR